MNVLSKDRELVADETEMAPRARRRSVLELISRASWRSQVIRVAIAVSVRLAPIRRKANSDLVSRRD